jgi:hypothetical protein
MELHGSVYGEALGETYCLELRALKIAGKLRVLMVAENLKLPIVLDLKTLQIHLLQMILKTKP